MLVCAQTGVQDKYARICASKNVDIIAMLLLSRQQAAKEEAANDMPSKWPLRSLVSAAVCLTRTFLRRPFIPSSRTSLPAIRECLDFRRWSQKDILFDGDERITPNMLETIAASPNKFKKNWKRWMVAPEAGPFIAAQVAQVDHSDNMESSLLNMIHANAGFIPTSTDANADIFDDDE